jgi:HlyD family secretion protein
MTRKGVPKKVIAALAVIGLGVGAYALWERPAPVMQFEGWIEANLIFVSPDETGRIVALNVREGDTIEEGKPLFGLDADLQRDALTEAEATLANTRVNYERAKELLKKTFGSQKTYDDAEAAMRTAEARVSSARTRLERRRMASPVTGTVQEIYFRVGEMVQSGRPVVSLLPPGNTRVRFFVPQAALPRFQIGGKILIRCDGCASGLTAHVSFLSIQAEFTPPIIYSQEERSRLVFRVEAIPDAPEKLRVGQPVTVTLLPAEATANAKW